MGESRRRWLRSWVFLRGYEACMPSILPIVPMRLRRCSISHGRGGCLSPRDGGSLGIGRQDSLGPPESGHLGGSLHVYVKADSEASNGFITIRFHFPASRQTGRPGRIDDATMSRKCSSFPEGWHRLFGHVATKPPRSYPTSYPVSDSLSSDTPCDCIASFFFPCIQAKGIGYLSE